MIGGATCVFHTSVSPFNLGLCRYQNNWLMVRINWIGQLADRPGKLCYRRGNHLRHALKVIRPINPEWRLHNGQLYD